MTCAFRLPAKSRDTNVALRMTDQKQKVRPFSPGPSPSGGGNEGPKAPQVDRPNTEELLKKMRKVDPDQARRYRQRTGQ